MGLCPLSYHTANICRISIQQYWKEKRRAKRAAKDGLIKEKEDTKMHDISKTITLEDLTNPEKDK